MKAIAKYGRQALSSATLMTQLSFVLRTLNLLLVLPLVLRRFSPEETTLYLLFGSLMSLRSLADFGFGATLSRCTAYAMGGAASISHATERAASAGAGTVNDELLRKVCGCTRTIYGRLSLLAVLLMVTLGTWAVLSPIAQITTPWRGWAAWAAICTVIYVSFRNQEFSAFLQGTNHVALLRRWEAVFFGCAISSSAAVLLLGGDILWMVLVNQTWIALSAIRNRWLAHHVLDGWLPRHSGTLGFDKETFTHIWPATWRSGLGQAFYQGTVVISGIVYAHMADAVDAAMMLLGLRLIDVIAQFSRAAFYSRLPIYAKLYSEKKLTLLTETACYAMRQSYLHFVVIWLAAAIAGPPALRFIGSATPFPSQAIWAALGFATLLNRYAGMHMQIYSTSNHIVWHYANAITGIIHVVVIAALLPRIGAIAIPVAMIASHILFACWYAAAYSSRIIEWPWTRFECRTSLAPGMVAVLYCLLAVWP